MKSITCPKCGTEFKGNFCPNCGHSVQVRDKGCAISLAIIISFAVLIFGALYIADTTTPDDVPFHQR